MSATALDPRRSTLEAQRAHALRRLALADEVEREHGAQIAQLREFADRLEASSPPLVADLRASATAELERAEADLRDLES